MVLLYAVAGVFGGLAEAPVTITQARLSSVVDAIVLLRMVEEHHQIDRLLSIVKVRSSAHDSDWYLYHITGNGVEIGERLPSERGTVT